jgi:hypothetical protein
MTNCVDRLIEVMGKYPEVYDEVFWQISKRLREQGCATKADVAALICWKRSGQGSWVTDLLKTPEAEVREATKKAFAATNDQQCLDELAVLPGFGSKFAVALTLLTAYDPENFGVVDRRALKGLERLGCPIKRGRGETLRYLVRVRELRDKIRTARVDATCRNVDQGLYVIGGE